MDRTTSRIAKSIPKPHKAKEKSKPTFINEHDKEKIKASFEKTLKFSFRFFDRTHDAFNCGGTDINWYMDFLDSVKSVSQLTLQELKQGQRNRCHDHDWTRAKFPYPLTQELFAQIEEDCYQFSLSKGGGRVHGFVMPGSNTFYVVWLDPHHNMYPDEKYGGVKCFKGVPDQYETLEIQYQELHNKYLELMEQLDKLTAP